MASSANALLTNYVASTMDKYRKGFADGVHDTCPLLYVLKRRGNMRVEDGGNQFHTSVSLDKSNTTFYDPTSDAVMHRTNDVKSGQFKGTVYDWNFLTTKIIINAKEKFLNTGRSAIFNLGRAKISQAKESLAEVIDDNIFDSDANSASAFMGLDLLCTDDGTGVYGGLDPGDGGVYAAWTNQHVDGMANYSDMAEKLGELWRKLKIVKAIPRVIVMTGDGYGAYEAVGQNQAKFTDQKLLDLGFAELTYKGIPIYFTDKCVDGNSKDVTYMLDVRSLGFYVHRQRNVEVEPWRKAELYDEWYMNINWMGGLWCENRRRQGVITWKST